MLKYDIADKIIYIVLLWAPKKIKRLLEKDEDIDGKGGGNEVDETLNTVSYKNVKESKKETNQIGDSDRE